MGDKFKVGDRVKVFGGAWAFHSPYNHMFHNDGCNGTVRHITDKLLHVRFDDLGAQHFEVHPKQCRRLVKRNRREFEISRYPSGVLGVIEFGQCLENGESVRVREVRKK